MGLVFPIIFRSGSACTSMDCLLGSGKRGRLGLRVNFKRKIGGTLDDCLGANESIGRH